MTAQPLTTRPARQRTDRGAQLRAVPPARLATPKAPFVVLVLGLLGGGLVGLLLLNTALAQGAFALRDLQRSGVTLSERQQALQQRIADEQQPAALARKARALGMVSGGVPAFVRLPDGRVLGTPRHAGSAATPAAAATLPPLPPASAITPLHQKAGARSSAARTRATAHHRAGTHHRKRSAHHTTSSAHAKGTP